MFNSTSSRINIDKAFASLLGILLLLNLPFFLNIILPLHDTMSVYQVFYVFYNDLFFHNKLLQWLPFSFYGVQSNFYFITHFSPASFFAGLIGWVLNIKNVLFLFNLSLFIEQLIFLIGIYILSQLLFRNKITIFLICLIAITSIVLIYQMYWNFRLFYFLPLIIYFLQLFFSRYKPQYLILAMIIFIISLFGLNVYMMVIPFLAVSIIFSVLLMGNYKSWGRFLELARGDIFQGVLYFAVFILLSTVYYYYITHAMNFIEPLVHGRDPVTLATNLDIFLTYGGNTNFTKFIELIFPACLFVTLDNTLYVGLITLFFAAYGLVKIKNPIQVAFISVIIIFTLFSAGIKPVAVGLYHYFPGMKYFRHIGLVAGSLKLFLLLLAGFGLDHFLDRPERQKKGVKTILMMEVFRALIAIGIGGTLAYIYLVFPYQNLYSIISNVGNLPLDVHTLPLLSIPFILYPTLVAGILLFLYWLLKYFPSNKHFAIFIICCSCVEMFGYQALVNGGFYLKSKNVPLTEEAITVNRYKFQEKRTAYPPDKRAKTILPLAENTIKYVFAYNYLQWDPDVPIYRTEFVNAYVASLIRLKNGKISKFVFKDGKISAFTVTLPNDINFLNSLGYESSKLKLVSDVAFADTEVEAENMVKNRKDIDTVPVLIGVSKNIQSSWKNAGTVDGTIRVNGFNANGLETTINCNSDAWLYYADAWHSGWKGFVNGKEVPVIRANIAFKALKLDRGTNTVRFVFDDKPSRICVYIMVVSGLIFTFVTIAYTISNVLFKGQADTLKEDGICENNLAGDDAE